MVYGCPVEGAMDRKKRCKNRNCRRVLDLNPRVKDQEYCSRKTCQRVRKRRWQKQKIATDADYQENQKSAQAKWRAANPDYWRNYRQQHEKYCERNRLLQKKRDANRRRQRLAKMDALKDENPIIPMGCYHITFTPADLAKMDAYIQKVIIIPDGYKKIDSSCKEGLDRQLPVGSIRCQTKEETDDASSALPGPGP